MSRSGCGEPLRTRPVFAGAAGLSPKLHSLRLQVEASGCVARNKVRNTAQQQNLRRGSLLGWQTAHQKMVLKRGAKTAPARGARKTKGRTPSPKGRGKKKGRSPSPRRKGTKDRRGRTAPSSYSDSDSSRSRASSRSRSPSQEPSLTGSQEQEELAEGIETLVDLERDLHALRTERLREENEAIKKERDAWRQRAEGGLRSGFVKEVAYAPPPPARPPRRHSLIKTQADAAGGWSDEEDGADDVVDLGHALAGNERFATLVKRVHAQAAGDEQRCAVSHALLAGNDLTDLCEPSLFDFVSAQRLRVLDLEDNALGLSGVEAVCKALADASGASGTRLQRLCLASNSYGDDKGAGEALGEALYKGSKDGFLQKLFEVTCTFSDDPRLARDGSTPVRMALGVRTPGHPLGDNPMLPHDPNATDAPPVPPVKVERKRPEKKPAAKRKSRGNDDTRFRKDPSDLRPLNAASFLAKLSLEDAAKERAEPQLAALVALALRGASITRDAVKSLCKMRRLTALDLSFAFVGPKGAADLANSLVKGADPRDPGAAGLTYLDLTHNGIGDAGVLALAAALDGSLRKPQPGGYYDLAVDKRARDDGDGRARKLGLTAHNHDDGPSARDAFARARRDASKKPATKAEKPSSRRKAKPRDRKTRDDRSPPPPPTKRAPSLTVLDVSANRIGQRGARALALALKRSPTLASVNVGRNDLGADACAALLKAGVASQGLFELKGARAAGARAADVASFARHVADRTEVSRRSSSGGGRTRTITIREDDDNEETEPIVCDAPPDATLRFAAGAGPLMAQPPPVDEEALRKAEREREEVLSLPEDMSEAEPPSALGRAILNAAKQVRAACGATSNEADDAFALAWSPAEVATMRRERPCLPAPPPRSAWTCIGRSYAPVAGQLVVSWATCVHPAPVGFRWHLVRSRPLGGGVSDGLASGSRAGETATPDEPDAYYPRGSPWAWHTHRLDVPDALPCDVLSLWAAPDGPEDLGRQATARLVARDLTVGLADAHLAAHPEAACLHDAAMLALPFHDSAPLDSFDGTGRG